MLENIANHFFFNIFNISFWLDMSVMLFSNAASRHKSIQLIGNLFHSKAVQVHGKHRYKVNVEHIAFV